MDKQHLYEKTFTLSARLGHLFGRVYHISAVKQLLLAAQQFALCAVLARGTIFGEYAPFGVAMVGAVCVVSSGFGAVLGAFFGYLILTSSISGVGNSAAVLLTMACSHIFSDFNCVTSAWFMPLVATACFGACSFVFLPPMTASTAAIFICILVLTFGSAYFYRISLLPPNEDSVMLRPGALLVLLTTLLVSVSDLSVGGIVTPARVAALTLVMGATYVGGSSAGTAAGIAFGVTMDAAAGRSALFACTYGFGALISGGFRGGNRQVFAAIYLCAGTAAALLGAEHPLFVSSIAEGILAAVFFAVIPTHVWLYLRETLLPSQPELTDAVRRIRTNARRYAGDAAQAFYEMYLGMSSGLTQGRRTASEDTREVFDHAAEQICCKCSLCASCWEHDYIGTLNALNDVSLAMLQRGRAQAADFPSHFSARCIRFPEFVRAINETFVLLQQKREYQSKCEENRSLLAQQYAGLTGILQHLGTDLSQDVVTLPARERQVRRYAAAFGTIEQVAVYRDGSGRLRIELGGRQLDAFLTQKDGFAAGLAALLGIGLTEPEQICDELGPRLLLREQAPFRAIIGIGQRKKPGESVSGDTGRYFVTESGVACMLLSDGMGTGELAARDSRTVLGHLERFLRAGLDIRDALQTVAPAFRLQNDGTRFVTLDMLTVDLYSGRAETLKCGAAPAYLRTGGNITRLNGQALPIGLMENGEMGESVPLRLVHGDVYVMLSDGINDGFEDGWVMDMLLTRISDGPKELAAQLVTAAASRGGQDDMTALVLRIEKTR